MRTIKIIEVDKWNDLKYRKLRIYLSTQHILRGDLSLPSNKHREL